MKNFNSFFNQLTAMPKRLAMVLTVLFTLGVGSVWGQELLFHETFGDNSNSARNWSDSYSVKSGISEVYADVTYTMTNLKQSKNTVGCTQSGLVQTTKNSDASIVIGPLNVTNYEDLELLFMYKAGSVNGTYKRSAQYKTSSNGSWIDLVVTGTQHQSTCNEQTVTLPSAVAGISTLYIKIVFNTSNVGATIDEVEITGTKKASCTKPIITTQPTGATYAKDATATALKVVATGDDLTYQWYSNASNSTSGATTINNATNSTYTPATSTVGTKYYYCIVSSGSCSTRSNIVSVVISPTYTVTYNANGATSGTVPTDATKYNGGATVTVKGNSGNLAKTGYTFAGWNTKADGTGTTYAAGTGTFTISSNTTLYAKWTTNTYTVTWIVDGETKRTDTGVAYNTSKIAPTVSPVPCGDVIAGWTDAVDGNYEHGTSTLHLGATPSITITSDITFYAVFADYVNE